jgi:hypothetical protein
MKFKITVNSYYNTFDVEKRYCFFFWGLYESFLQLEEAKKFIESQEKRYSIIVIKNDQKSHYSKLEWNLAWFLTYFIGMLTTWVIKTL